MNICTPALIYIFFSVTQIIIDTFKGYYNTAFFKVIISILVTILLNALCQSGMGIISWFIVFIPFIFMTFIVSLLLYIFGLDIATGTLQMDCNNCNNNNSNTGNLIFSSSLPSSTSTTTPTTTTTTTTTQQDAPTSYSSDPAYESFILLQNK